MVAVDRVVILALDGLEYELVKRWRLKSLLQEKHGVHMPFKSPRLGKPHTPSLWASFITGKSLEEHGVDEWWRWSWLLDRIRYLPPLVWIKGKRRIIEKLTGYRIKPKPSLRALRNRPPTLFDLIKPSIAIDVPTWNMDVDRRLWIERSLKVSVDEYIKNVWKVYNEKKQELLRVLDNGSWRLVMVWFDAPDLLGHVCIAKCRLKLMSLYLDLNRLVSTVRERVGDDTLVLVVSDHGMKPMPDGTGDHSDYGFWSISHYIDWFEPRKITDFFYLILKLLGENSETR